MSNSIEYKQEWKDEDARVIEEIIAANGNLDRSNAVREKNWRNLVKRFTDSELDLNSLKPVHDSEHDETIYQKARIYTTVYQGKPIWIKAGWTSAQKEDVAGSNNQWYRNARDEGHGDLHPSILEGRYYTVMEYGGNNIFDLLSGTKDETELAKYIGYILDFYGVENPHTEFWTQKVALLEKNLLDTLRVSNPELSDTRQLSRREAERSLVKFIEKDIEFIKRCKEGLVILNGYEEYVDQLSTLESKLSNILPEDVCGPYCPTVLSVLDPRRNLLLKEEIVPSDSIKFSQCENYTDVDVIQPKINIIDQPGYAYELMHTPLPLKVGFLYKMMRAEEIPEVAAKYIQNRLLQEFVGLDGKEPLNKTWASKDLEKMCDVEKLVDLGYTHYELLVLKTQIAKLPEQLTKLVHLTI